MKRYLVTGVLILILVGVIALRALRRSHSQGLAVRIVSTQCGDQDLGIVLRRVRVRIHKEGSLSINHDLISSAELRHRIDDIFLTRNERVVFFDADDSISYQDAIAVVETLQSSPGVKVLLMTPSTRTACRKDEDLVIPGAAAPPTANRLRP